jgi:hypothetical protein
VRHDVIHLVLIARRLLSADPKQRQPLPPRGRAGLPEPDLHRRVAVGVTLDRPLETEVQQSRVLHVKTSGLSCVLSIQGTGSEKQHAKTNHSLGILSWSELQLAMPAIVPAYVAQ